MNFPWPTRWLSPLLAASRGERAHWHGAALPPVPTARARGRRLELHVPPVAWRKSAGAMALIVAGLGLGMLLSAQWQTRPVQPVAAPTESRREVALATIRQLEAEQVELKQAIGDLRQRVAHQQQQALAGRVSLRELTLELERQRLLAGMTAISGPGVRLVLDDSNAKSVPVGEDPAMYIIHEYQLRDVVNQLWLAGAEAIAINGERVVNHTSIYCVGSTILVNDTRLSPPYEIVALGDPAALDAAIQHPANLISLKARVKTYGIQFTLTRGNELSLPAYHGSLQLRHAQPSAPAQLGDLPRARVESDAY